MKVAHQSGHSHSLRSRPVITRENLRDVASVRAANHRYDLRQATVLVFVTHRSLVGFVRTFISSDQGQKRGGALDRINISSRVFSLKKRQVNG
ncbi:hypothetical protein [Pseudoxanthomonas japonensis]|uniref:hypothetical protein n=1 Tax=Pseudoxanthomonas japonensis TaxID=69284 RepID=UPI001390FAAD|nr:hypothetical protein [Pseudoxanthomonas japonensis]